MRAAQRNERPFVFINMSMTADGKIATENRAVSSFSSKADQEHLLELRTMADAVMCGARTADLNKINLGPGHKKYRAQRVKSGLAEYNLRVVVSGSGSLDTKAEIFQHHFSPIIVLTTERATAGALRRLRTAANAVHVCGKKEIHFPAALRWLRKEWKVKRLLCEGGGELNDALFRAGLVDELHLTVCPLILGGRKAPTIADDLGAGSLSAAAKLRLKSLRRVGAEVFLVYSAE
ncbi:MAG: dihydrofolate reductase family protein [Verrucomicrobiota bacterium]